jgi:hypothetical protein
MVVWQFKIKMKEWADDGSDEFEHLAVGEIFPQYVKPVKNKIDNCIGDIVLYYNSTTLKSRQFYEGVYLVCEIVSTVNDDFIKLKIIKDLRETPYIYDKDFEDLHIYQNTAEERGRSQTYELINTAKCNIEKFYETIMTYKTEGDSLLEDIVEIRNNKEVKKTEQDNLVKCRLGQGTFRKDLILYWKGCSVTKFNQMDVLIASHIKPWKDSSDTERLDSFNGLLLIPTIDKLFDKGYISFSNNGKIMISKKLGNNTILGIHSKMIINISSKHKKYLKYHREKVFQD